mmetsp:Transcript_2836/g.7874  ORF Transcript_2836/g.7874 Transcript_2836/m.7874 type:complete len:213 (+) Transcript_2836:178-816(+)
MIPEKLRPAAARISLCRHTSSHRILQRSSGITTNAGTPSGESTLAGSRRQCCVVAGGGALRPLSILVVLTMKTTAGSYPWYTLGLYEQNILSLSLSPDKDHRRQRYLSSPTSLHSLLTHSYILSHHEARDHGDKTLRFGERLYSCILCRTSLPLKISLCLSVCASRMNESFSANISRSHSDHARRAPCCYLQKYSLSTPSSFFYINSVSSGE